VIIGSSLYVTYVHVLAMCFTLAVDICFMLVLLISSAVAVSLHATCRCYSPF